MTFGATHIVTHHSNVVVGGVFNNAYEKRSSVLSADSSANHLGQDLPQNTVLQLHFTLNRVTVNFVDFNQSVVGEREKKISFSKNTK